MTSHMLGNLILLLSLPAVWFVVMVTITAIEKIYKKLFE